MAYNCGYGLIITTLDLQVYHTILCHTILDHIVLDYRGLFWDLQVKGLYRDSSAPGVRFGQKRRGLLEAGEA